MTHQAQREGVDYSLEVNCLGRQPCDYRLVCRPEQLTGVGRSVASRVAGRCECQEIRNGSPVAS
jgi:hypothetical protein